LKLVIYMVNTLVILNARQVNVVIWCR